MRFIALVAVAIVAALMLYPTGDFPDWGDPNSPANGEGSVSQYYVEEIRAETHVPNMVTAVLADYRGFDTMFETVVIFVAGIAIIAVLRVTGAPPSPQLVARPRPDIDVIMTCRLVVPVLQLFALYVVAHGHYSPGGGFQGGVMMGASYILLALASGLDEGVKRLSESRAIQLAGIGIVIYGGTGLLCMFMGENFLDYHILSEILPGVDPIMARYHAMLVVEIGVAFTVTTIMFSMFANLSSKGTMRGGL